MPTAIHRRYFDADSHILEPSDWLVGYVDPKLRDQLRPLPAPKDLNMAKGAERVAARASDPDAVGTAFGRGYEAYGAFDPAERITVRVQFARTEPDLQALPMPAADYIRRQVKFTPFPKDDVAWITEQVGPDMLMFSTDTPHPEGTKNPIERFAAPSKALTTPPRNGSTSATCKSCSAPGSPPDEPGCGPEWGAAA